MSIIEKNEKLHADISKFVADAIVAKLAQLGVDTITNSPEVFTKSIIDKQIRMDNLMFPDTPKKDGIYFTKNGLFVGFIHVPREEGISMIPDLMEDHA
jgi:hypothetical protein